MKILPKKVLVSTYKKNIVENMKQLNTYKPEFETIIDIYAELLKQFNELNKKFIDEDMPYETDTAQGGAKKAPIVATLESLRKDILSYSDRLQLNPKALQVETESCSKSSLARILQEMGNEE